jgi:hypothetical protein
VKHRYGVSTRALAKLIADAIHLLSPIENQSEQPGGPMSARAAFNGDPVAKLAIWSIRYHGRLKNPREVLVQVPMRSERAG